MRALALIPRAPALRERGDGETDPRERLGTLQAQSPEERGDCEIETCARRIEEEGGGKTEMSEIGRLIVRGLKEAARHAREANRPTQRNVDNIVRGVFPPLSHTVPANCVGTQNDGAPLITEPK